MSLSGIKVLEMAGLAPTPFLGMILADFGAKVTRVDKVHSVSLDTMARGKKSICVDLKKKEGANVVKQLAKYSDVLIEPFRPGIMEKLGLGPNQLQSDNPGLIYVRLSGFGQTGPYSMKAGHDINYIATSGVLSKLKRKNEKPVSPVNIIADFAGGGLLAAFGVMAALYERVQSKKGQVVDLGMVHGSAYVSSFLFTGHSLLFSRPSGENILDGGAPFYDTYQTKDGRFVAVGALEPQFFQTLIKGLALEDDEAFSNQMDSRRWEDMRKKLTVAIASRTLAQLSHLFDDDNSCVMPILSSDEAAENLHNKKTGLFFKDSSGNYIPNPTPNLSRTPAIADSGAQPILGGDTKNILRENKFSESQIEDLINIGAVEDNSVKSKL